MLIVSEFISDGYPGSPFLTLTDPLQVTLINLLTIENARDLVLSSVQFPFGNDQSRIAALLRDGLRGGRDKGTWMLLCTNRRRYWLPLDSYAHTIQEIEFMTPALQHLQDANEDDRLESVEVFVDGPKPRWNARNPIR